MTARLRPAVIVCRVHPPGDPPGGDARAREVAWDVRPHSWARHACAVAARLLTRAAWASALPGTTSSTGCTCLSSSRPGLKMVILGVGLAGSTRPTSSFFTGPRLPYTAMRMATSYLATAVRWPGVSPAGMALRISSPRW